MGARFRRGALHDGDILPIPSTTRRTRHLSTAYRARWGDNAVTNVTVADTYQAVYLFEKAAVYSWREDFCRPNGSARGS